MKLLGSFRTKFFMFSLCMSWFSPSTVPFSHSSKMLVQIIRRCEYLSVCITVCHVMDWLTVQVYSIHLLPFNARRRKAPHEPTGISGYSHLMRWKAVQSWIYSLLPVLIIVSGTLLSVVFIDVRKNLSGRVQPDIFYKEKHLPALLHFHAHFSTSTFTLNNLSLRYFLDCESVFCIMANVSNPTRTSAAPERTCYKSL